MGSHKVGIFTNQLETTERIYIGPQAVLLGGGEIGPKLARNWPQSGKLVTFLIRLGSPQLARNWPQLAPIRFGCFLSRIIRLARIGPNWPGLARIGPNPWGPNPRPNPGQLARIGPNRDPDWGRSGPIGPNLRFSSQSRPVLIQLARNPVEIRPDPGQSVSGVFFPDWGKSGRNWPGFAPP